MTLRKIEPLVAAIFCSVALASGGNAWASAPACNYTSPDAGIGGTGHLGTGTSTVAKGSGIGGTGLPQASTVAEMPIAGTVVSAQGRVEAQSNGRSRLLAKGDPICVGETIVTNETATVQLAMADEAKIAVLPQTLLKIEKYVYAGTGKDQSSMSLLKGGGRFVTGYIGKAHPENDVIRTPGATIGVRGTDHEARVVLPDESPVYRAGTYDKVNSGITFIRTEKGEIEIRPDQAGYAAGPADTPVLLPAVPDFYRASPSLGTERRPEVENTDKTPAESGPEKSDEHGNVSGAETSETGSPPGEPSRHHDAEGPVHTHHLPEPPQAPTLPEHPEVPVLPEHPEVPTVPDHPEVPNVPEHAEPPAPSEMPELPAQPET